MLVLKPSWLSGSFCVIMALFLTIGAMILAALSTSSFSQSIFAAHDAHSTISANYQAITTALSHYRLTNDLALFIFWGAVGVIVYFFLLNLIKSIKAVANVEQQMHYKHNKASSVLEDAGVHLVLRLVVVGFWFILITLLFHKLLPYDLAAASTAVKYFSLVHGIDVIIGTILLLIDFSLQTTCLRLLLLRERVFGGVIY